MLEEFQTINIFPVTAADVLSNLLAALICGIALSLIYRATYRGPSYSASFVNAIVMLCLIAALIILVIGNNLARAFGLVGAMSIIRFRTAVRDTMDMVFIFLSLAIGMACGVGLKVVALIGVLVAGIIIIILTYTNFAQPRKRLYLLQLAYDMNKINSLELEKLLAKNCKSSKLVNIKNYGNGKDIEAFYHVSFRTKASAETLTRQLNSVEGIRQTQVFFDEDDINAPS